MIRREFITLLGGGHRHGVAAAELVGAERGSGAIKPTTREASGPSRYAGSDCGKARQRDSESGA